MTNEEASCVLHCPDAYGGIYGQKYGEALAHCFELLKQEPIDHSELIELLYDNNVRCDQTIEGLADDIMSLQTGVR